MSESTVRTSTESFVDRFVGDLAGAFSVAAIYLGDRLGFYEALAAADEPLTAGALASATDTHERYVREWLEQQTVTGVLDCENASRPADERRFSLPAAHVGPLTDPDHQDYVAPFAQLVVAAQFPIERVVEAYRTGEGVPYEAYGEQFRVGQARANRGDCLRTLPEEWVPAVPGLVERLSRTDARVADVGCGAGYASIGIARAYPNARVDGYDLDEASVELARETVADAGLSDRISIHHADASGGAVGGDYDLVVAVECVHDMADPVGALATMRNLAGDDGTVLVVDERVGETFTGGTEGDDAEFEWLMYGWSVLHCLPVGMAEHPSAATGTVLRAGTMRGYASEAGFDETEELGVEHPFFRVYRLADESTGEEGRDA